MTTTQTRTPAIAVECILADDGLDHLIIKPANDGPIRVYPHELSSAIGRMAILHGLKQKLVDAAAISRDPETGRSATSETKMDAVFEVLQRLRAGEWNKRREGTPTGGLLFRALCRMQPGKDADVIRAFLAGKSDKEQAALRANPRVAAVIEEIKAERAGDVGGVDTDAMLVDLGDAE